ncbi:tRNA preQ1(34) S-adenosylmethionine ribosyltransferase-isomerase QueA [Leptospira sp. 96542]|nr:tRNA preQ1(34) S-adenosylmethionine ribosyltransferase-isomerase QueA [Leptospira sp. 96542]
MDELNEFDFDLPEAQIARFPASSRDESRLLVVDRLKSSYFEAPLFKDIVNFLHPGDVLVYNDTKVSKRRVYLQTHTGRIHESIFLEMLEPSGLLWNCILKNRSKLKLGDLLTPVGFSQIPFEYFGPEEDRSILKSKFPIREEDFESFGSIPIPPYLKRKADEEDNIRYQTIFAKEPGSVAAPTAGLHFTESLKHELQCKGIQFVPVQLKIGYGTFSPLTKVQWETKRLHSESYIMSEKTAEILNQTRADKNRVIAIGTTALRVLETVYDSQLRKYKAQSGQTDIFLSEGDTIHSIDGLITNFHLPKSSLLLLVSAFLGKKLLLDVYKSALEKNFRFYSYGDSMFLF